MGSYDEPVKLTLRCSRENEQATRPFLRVDPIAGSITLSVVRILNPPSASIKPAHHRLFNKFELSSGSISIVLYPFELSQEIKSLNCSILGVRRSPLSRLTRIISLDILLTVNTQAFSSDLIRI